jgi:hypothetical protein
MTVFGPILTQFRAFARKLVLITETGVPPGPRQAARITRLFAATYAAGLAGLIWFDASARQRSGSTATRPRLRRSGAPPAAENDRRHGDELARPGAGNGVRYSPVDPPAGHHEPGSRRGGQQARPRPARTPGRARAGRTRHAALSGTRRQQRPGCHRQVHGGHQDHPGQRTRCPGRPGGTFCRSASGAGTSRRSGRYLHPDRKRPADSITRPASLIVPVQARQSSQCHVVPRDRRCRACDGRVRGAPESGYGL